MEKTITVYFWSNDGNGRLVLASTKAKRVSNDLYPNRQFFETTEKSPIGSVGSRLYIDSNFVLDPMLLIDNRTKGLRRDFNATLKQLGRYRQEMKRMEELRHEHTIQGV